MASSTSLLLTGVSFDRSLPKVGFGWAFASASPIAWRLGSSLAASALCQWLMAVCVSLATCCSIVSLPVRARSGPFTPQSSSMTAGPGAGTGARWAPVFA